MSGRNNFLRHLAFQGHSTELFSMRASELIWLDMSILSYQATGQYLGGAAAHGSIRRLTRKGALDSQLCPEQHRPDKCHCNVARILQSQKGGLNCHSPVPPRSPKSLFRKTHLTIPFKEKLWCQRKLDMKTDPFPIIPFSNKADM